MPEQVVFDLRSPAFAKDRYELLRQFREGNPVIGHPATAMSGRAFTEWNVFRYDDVQFILKDQRFRHEISKVVGGEAPAVPEAYRALVETQNNWMLLRDPPDHTRLRSLVSQAFTPRMVDGMATHIRDVANDLLAGLNDKMEVVSEYAFPLPVIVIAQLLGVPVEDRELFKEWSNVLIQTLDFNGDIDDIFTRGSQVVTELRAYFRTLVRERERSPREDLISGMVAARGERGEGAKISEEELLDTCILLLSAGHETTVNLISNSILLLMQYPDALQQLRSNPGLLASAVEETLRLESPVQVTSRCAAEDVDLCDQLVKKGDLLHVWLASANRDAKHFEEAETFDIARQPNRHLAFSTGAHFCLGAPLARLEGQIALKAFLARFSSFEMLQEAPVWKTSVLMRSLANLPVRVS